MPTVCAYTCDWLLATHRRKRHVRLHEATTSSSPGHPPTAPLPVSTSCHRYRRYMRSLHPPLQAAMRRLLQTLHAFPASTSSHHTPLQAAMKRLSKHNLIQSIVNRRLSSPLPPGLRVALYPKALVRSAQPNTPCLRRARVVRCASCAPTAAAQAELMRLLRQKREQLIASGTPGAAEEAECAQAGDPGIDASRGGAWRYLPTTAFHLGGKGLRQGQG